MPHLEYILIEDALRRAGNIRKKELIYWDYCKNAVVLYHFHCVFELVYPFILIKFIKKFNKFTDLVLGGTIKIINKKNGEVVE